MDRDDIAGEDLQRFETPEEAFQYLRLIGTQADDEINLAEAVLALALAFLPGLNIGRYRQHLKKMCDTVRDDMAFHLRQKEADTLALRVQVLRKVIHETHHYAGDAEHYDDIQNANIVRVIERRKGLPIALGLIYIIVADAQGWVAQGLNFPGHFVLRLEKDGERIILDPFRGGCEMNAAELRQLLKSIAGKGAELSHNFYDPVSRRDMLVRLQNNLKKRLIEQEDYAQAVLVLETMEALAPQEYRTLFDKGVLYAKLGQAQQAIKALEEYIKRNPNVKEQNHARMILRQIKPEGER